MAVRPLKADPAKDPTLDVEHAALADGVKLVIGVDEVGRGAIAGPVAVGVHAYLADHGAFPAGLRDSKLISAQRREALIPLITEWGQGAVGYGSAAEIDEYGITTMLGQAARRALLELASAGIAVPEALIIVDGSHDWLSPVLQRPLRVVTRVGGDRQCASIAAASVRAKVARDALMGEAHEQTPHYEWHSNKGYGSAAHYAGIRAFGISPLHRRTWIKSENSPDAASR